MAKRKATYVLRCLRYHRYRGLRYHSQHIENSIGNLVEVLEKQSETVHSMKEKQALIDKKPLLVRWFFWLFNINHYARDAYILAGLQVIREDSRTIVTEKVRAEQARPWYERWQDTHWAFRTIYQYCSERMIATEAPFYTTTPDEAGPGATSPANSGDIDLSSLAAFSLVVRDPLSQTVTSSPIEPEHPYIVTTTMLDYLSIVGLPCLKEGDTLTISMIKKAYYATAKSTHPDRGNPTAAFQKLGTALDALLALLQQEEDPASAFNTTLTQIRQRIRAINETLDHIHDTWDHIHEKWDHIHEKWDHVHEKWDHIHEKWDHVHEKWDNIQETWDRVCAEQEESRHKKALTMKKLTQIEQGVAYLEKRLDERDLHAHRTASPSKSNKKRPSEKKTTLVNINAASRSEEECCSPESTRPSSPTDCDENTLGEHPPNECANSNAVTQLGIFAPISPPRPVEKKYRRSDPDTSVTKVTGHIGNS